jgi:hypothetical protein
LELGDRQWRERPLFVSKADKQCQQQIRVFSFEPLLFSSVILSDKYPTKFPEPPDE